MPTVTTPQTTLHYQFDPMPGRPVLVLSNSLATDLSMWSLQANRFGQQFSLLRYDTRGHGNSAVPAGPYTIEQLAGDVLALLDALQIKQAHFCGISLGGMVGQWLGANAPQRLLSLVLADTAAQSGDAGFWNGRIDAAILGGMSAIIPDVLGGWFTEGFCARKPDEVERVSALIRATKVEGFAACCEAIRDMDQQASASKIRVPTLVAYGRHDVATPPSASKFLLEQIAGSEELVLEAGHIANIEDPEEFNRGVLEFLLRQDRKA